MHQHGRRMVTVAAAAVVVVVIIVAIVVAVVATVGRIRITIIAVVRSTSTTFGVNRIVGHIGRYVVVPFVSLLLLLLSLLLL